MARNILHFNGEISVGSQMPFVIVAMFAGPPFGGQTPIETARARIAARRSRLG